MAKDFKEKIIKVNLRAVFQKPDTKRAICAKNMLKEAVRKETRLNEFSISNKVNELLWANGKYKAPRKITVKVIKENDRGIILLPEEKYEAKQDKKKTENKKEPAKVEEKAEAKTEGAKKETKEKAPKAKKE